jgi:DNA-binding NarL/FixJ family response regulator
MSPFADRVIRLGVFNDYPVVVAGVVALLEPYGDRVHVEAFVDELPPRGHLDIALFDLFAAVDPEARLRQIVDRTGARVLAYGWPQSAEQIAAALRMGATGFLQKTVDGAELASAIEATAAGERIGAVCAPDVTTMTAWPGRAEGLTAREAEILALIVAGLSNQQIATAMWLSINSVKTYIRSAYRRIGATSRTQAVLWGIDHGFRLESAEALRRAGLRE